MKPKCMVTWLFKISLDVNLHANLSVTWIKNKGSNFDSRLKSEKLNHCSKDHERHLLCVLYHYSFQLFAWGYNGNGQLGVGNNANQLTPCKVIGLVGTITTQVGLMMSGMTSWIR